MKEYENENAIQLSDIGNMALVSKFRTFRTDLLASRSKLIRWPKRQPTTGVLAEAGVLAGERPKNLLRKACWSYGKIHPNILLKANLKLKERADASNLFVVVLGGARWILSQRTVRHGTKSIGLSEASSPLKVLSSSAEATASQSSSVLVVVVLELSARFC
ncbi:hypothetical protein Tco_0878225 [Tanacetum coccineum]|uniref:Uncharacterized protein n=1 Tax=Tanacetum coccineum TaxID=301880 RepID=A0ABQ5BZ55_9ASTR